ncbi:Vacuolar protein sorting-associated protein 17 [Ceratobasidium sp. 370]|nr:Vacuolar protein sorting-associated protein 17 [Ceratobasidium sp. 370]
MMDDPLGTSPFASSPSLPAWPSTPHTPNSPGPQPTLPRPASPLPPSQIVGAGPYGREPQIYGQPTPGLISPQATTAANGSKFERDGQYLRVRITGLDRNRRDIIIRIDAQTNLPNFTGSTYRNISRSYVEFQRFAEQIAFCCPQTIVPALPLPQTSAPSDEEDDRLVKVMLQRWFSRVCEDPILVREDEIRSFIESDFGYQPTPRPRRKTGSSFSLIKRSVPDEDEDLMSARLELTRLEVQFFDAAKAMDRLAKARKALSAAHAEMGNKLINVATTEAHPPLGIAIRKFGRVWHSISDVDQAQGLSECVIIGDALGYQGMNAKAAKETLQHRTQVLEDYQSAVKATIAKRRNIERLKASSNIRPDKVDEALEDMEEANKVEQLYQRRVEGISENLHGALRTHARHAHEDITHTLIEHARASIHYEKSRLRELETLRADVARAAGPAQSVAVSNGRAPLPPPIRGPLIQPPLTSGSAHSSGPPSPRVAAPRPAGQQPMPAPVPAPPGPPAQTGSHSQPVSAGPSTPVPAASHVDPLVGTPRPQAPTPAHMQASLPGSQAQSPLGPLVSSNPGTPNPPHTPVHPLAKSMFVQPTHKRLDAREAAAKLANMF